jgi:hypothetical protein
VVAAAAVGVVVAVIKLSEAGWSPVQPSNGSPR